MDASNTAFDGESLLRVETAADIDGLADNTMGILVRCLSDQKLASIAGRVPNLRHLVTDGNNAVTDEGLVSLVRFSRLEALDLEWSAVTDQGLQRIAAVGTLRWIDLGFCTGVTAQGFAWLRHARPDLDIIWVAA